MHSDLADGRAQMCPPSSPFRQKPIIKMQQDMKVMYPHRADVVHAEKTFIYDNQACMDWCENPLLTQLVSFIMKHRSSRRAVHLYKTTGGGVGQCHPPLVKAVCTIRRN
jgi:hypothetical protein